MLSDLTTRLSKLNHLFLTNNPPSETEEVEIKRILTAAQDNTIASEDDRANVQDLVTKCKTALSCVRRMPPELISGIFGLCVPRHFDDSQPWNTLDITCIPWVLTRVGSLWRTIAIQTVELWTYIKIDLEKMAESGKLEPPLPMLETALERSGSMPLRVFFHDSYKPSNRAQEMLSCLMTHSHRWSQLSIFISYDHLFLTNQVKGRLPLLQYLNIGAYGANTFPLLEGFAVAPMLRDLLVADEWEGLILPWAQLTSFGGNTKSFPGRFIGQCPNLLRCHFYFPRGPFTPGFEPVLRHEGLTHITINVIGVLNGMVLPSLQELVITKDKANDRDLHSLANFFQHSGNSLKAFSWRNAEITNLSVFKTLLQNIPNLTRLEIDLSMSQWPLQAIVLMQLTVTQSWCVLPRLESVKIQFNPYEYVAQPSINFFLDMVESRWFRSSRQDIAQIQQAKITELNHDLWTITPPAKERIDILRAQGLVLVFID